MSANPSAEGAASAAIEHGLVEHFRAALPGLYSDAARGAGLEGVVAAITPWFATFQQPQRTEAEWREWWNAYAVICGHHSLPALAGALKVWAAKGDSEFLPKPGALSEIASITPTAAFRLAGHVHNILQIADDRTDRQRVLDGMERDAVKPEERVKAVRNMLADFQAKSIPVRSEAAKILQRGVNYVERGDEPYIGGQCAPGSALTAQMLRSLGRPEPQPLIGEEPASFSDGI